MYKLLDELTPAEKMGIRVEVKIFTPEEGQTKRTVLDSDSEKLEPEEDGFLLASDEDVSFGLIVRTPNRKNYQVVLVSQGQDRLITPLGNFTPEQEQATFIRTVKTHPIAGGRTTKPVDNSLRVIVVQDKILSMFEMAIATRPIRDGIQDLPGFFLTVQKMYETPLYLQAYTGGIVADNRQFPGFKNWTGLKKAVAGMIEKSELAEVPEEALLERTADFNIKSGQAVVLFFNPATGLGKAMVKGGGVSTVHWSNINTQERFPYLASGQEISYSATQQNEKGIQLVGIGIKELGT